MAKKKRARRTTKRSTRKNSKDSERKLFAFLATFLTIIGFIIALLVKRDDKYVMFYAKQGLVLFIIQLIIWAVGAVLFFVSVIIVPILWILFIVVWIMAWINALSGEKRDTWLIGEFAKKIKL